MQTDFLQYATPQQIGNFGTTIGQDLAMPANMLNVATPDVQLDVTEGGSLWDNLSGNLQGIGTIASVIGGIMNNRSNDKYRKDLLAREDERIAIARADKKKFDKNMDQAYG